MTHNTINSNSKEFAEILELGNTTALDNTNPCHLQIMKYASANKNDTRELNSHFYYSFYNDLRTFSVEACIEHWDNHGKSENRFSTLLKMVEHNSNADKLPDQFNIPSYLSQNPDLVGVHEYAWQIMLHYLNNGIDESRDIEPLYIDNDFISQLYGLLEFPSNSPDEVLRTIRSHYSVHSETPIYLNKKELFSFYGLNDSTLAHQFNVDLYTQTNELNDIVVDNEAKALLHFFENNFNLSDIERFSQAKPEDNKTDDEPGSAIVDTTDFHWNTVFDQQYYQQQSNTYSEKRINEHYKSTGVSMGHSPSPFLALEWYATKHPQIKHEGVDPLEHLLKPNHNKWNNPRPCFDSEWYEKKYLESQCTSIHPLAHYIETGSKNSHDPHPLFCTSWYRSQYLKGMEAIDPYLHFIEGGWKTNNPNPLFDVDYYLTQKGSSSAPDPLSHYIDTGWKKGLEPHIFFDTAYFLKNIGKRIQQININPLQIYFQHPEDVDTHILLKSDYYKKQISKIAQVEIEKSTVDYIIRGFDCIADPHPLFSKKYYYEKSGDVKSNGLDALTHYIRSGGNEKRPVHPLFDTKAYLASLPSDLDANPLAHYLTHGYYAGLPCRAAATPSTTTYALPPSRAVTEISRNAIHNFSITDEDLQNAKIGVFAHVFYPDLLEEVINHTNNIPGQTTLYISTDSFSKKAVIDQYCVEFSTHPWNIRVFENRGRDIAPFIVGFKDALQSIDYGVHIHTKKSKHYKNSFDAWRKYLYDGNLGSTILVKNILGLLSKGSIGAYMPDHYGPVVQLLQWGGNFELASSLLNQVNETLSKNTTLDFPSGSMFWFTKAGIKPLLDVDLSFEHFDPEAGQVDGTLAHAIERSFIYFVESANLEYCVGKVVDTTTSISEIAYGNRIFPNRHSRGELASYYPELTQFLTRPSLAKKPRLNLLIPTIETSQGYAGVSSALDMFYEIHKNLNDDFDARLIATDIPVSNTYTPPRGYQFEKDMMIDQDGLMVAIDGTKRSYSPISIRDNDVFVATAWWTAKNALHLTKQQNQLFENRSRKFCYLIQDYECGFHAWSTKYALADSTYRHPDMTIPIFNTQVLFDYFKCNDYYSHGHVYNPGINKEYKENIKRDTAKEKIVLLYARPHADRNCLSFIDAVVKRVTSDKPDFWRDWRFIAIGEDFKGSVLKAGSKIEVAGRLSIKEYAEYSSRAALAISLMVSPHPSYPPLELAEAGVKVLSNTYSNKNISQWHDNLSSIDIFDLENTSAALSQMASEWQNSPQSGWQAKSHIDWFFDGATNLESLASEIAVEVAKHTAPITKAA